MRAAYRRAAFLIAAAPLGNVSLLGVVDLRVGSLNLTHADAMMHEIWHTYMQIFLT
jgi:hypothetical protein